MPCGRTDQNGNRFWLYAQVGLLDIFIGKQVLAGVGQGDASVFHDISPVGNLQGKVGILFHKKDRGFVLLIDFANNSENLFYDQWGQAQGRFIQEKEPGSCHKGSCDRQHLLLTTAEGAP